MKARFPLSLKVLLWLLLNLLLLSAAALVVLFSQGGAGWDSLMRGPAGRRIQDLGTVVVSEYTAAGPASRPGVLARNATRFGAELLIFSEFLPDMPRPHDVLPAAVAARVIERPPVRGPRSSGPPEDPAGKRFGKGGPPPGKRPPPPGEPLFGEGPPPPRESPPPENVRQIEEARGRFLLHSSNPPAYWFGARVALPNPEARRSEIAVFVARVDSWWGVVRLLDLQPWLIAAGSVLAFSILFWLPPVLAITRDLRRLTTATEQIAEGKFDVRVPTARRDELGALGTSVNAMAGRLDSLVNGQKKFLGDVAHELGSPLGRLQVAIEILESRADAALQPQIADVREEVQQMSALVNELLAFTKAGLRPRAAELAAVALAPLVHDVATREGAAVPVAASVADDLAVRADSALLSRALANLVRNAVRYASNAGTITVTTRREGEYVLIAVEDDGPGVPAEALSRLGEPFYRPDVARTREAGGVGLGLSIVRSAVAACGGEVHFANRAPQGFRAEIRLAAA